MTARPAWAVTAQPVLVKDRVPAATVATAAAAVAAAAVGHDCHQRW